MSSESQAMPDLEEARDPQQDIVNVLVEAKITIDQQRAELDILRAKVSVLDLIQELITLRRAQPAQGGYTQPQVDITWVLQHRINEARERLNTEVEERRKRDRS